MSSFPFPVFFSFSAASLDTVAKNLDTSTSELSNKSGRLGSPLGFKFLLLFVVTALLLALLSIFID